MSDDGPLLVIEEGGEVHRLYLDAAVFGRSKACDLSFDRAGVSRRHCEIILRADGTLVRDLGSSHGTFLDGQRVHGESSVARGQVVRLGPRGPRLRILDARLGPATAYDDEPTRPVERTTQGIDDIVAPTETADAPPLAQPTVTRPAGRPQTTVASVPRAPAAEAPSQMPQVPTGKRSLFLLDVTLGLVLGAAAGVVLLVLVDLSPLRQALGL